MSGRRRLGSARSTRAPAGVTGQDLGLRSSVMGERPGVRHAIRNYSLLAVFGIVAGAAFLHFVWPAMSPFVPTAWSITYVLGLAAFDVAPRLWQRNFTTPDSFSMASDQY